ncbi:uridine kinase family protein [Solitalea koreensis]|uniref:Uridine kinase n=1 Tax=Solitalea koreensis TaxID=543615 RepID=A0A521BAI2_9SPHI|nr:ATPase/DNA packaging protein [Solitalea koreensis]SMO44097.1 uridine kinase [Solitalea koreensis]
MNHKPFIIGVAGGSGSGKTYFLQSLLKHFNHKQICIVSQDDYYIPVGELSAEENKLYNFDLPGTIDADKFYEDLLNLANGKIVYKQEYTFNNTQAIPRLLECKPAPIIVIEGLFIFHFPEINKLIDLRIFIEAHEELALKRRIHRDKAERGYSEDDILYKWHKHVLPAYKEFLLPYKPHVDFVIENNQVKEIDFISFKAMVEQRISNHSDI